ncbi:hypothetical protein AB4Z21_31120 [Paenibacillus sp. MCAF20]
MRVKELDYVRLKSGRRATILLVYTAPSEAYEIEYDGGNGEFDTCVPDDIVEIIA